MTTRAAGSVAFAFLLLAAVTAGRTVFVAAVVVLAVVALADLGTALGRIGTRPVLLAAAVPGIGIPLTAGVVGGDMWKLLPDGYAVLFLLAFALMLVFGRRSQVTVVIGATALAGLLVGLGTGALVLSREVAEGFRWVAALMLLTVAAEVGAPAGHHLALRRDRLRREEGERRTGGSGLVSAPELLGSVLLATVAAVLFAVLWSPPFSPASIGALGLAVVVARVIASELDKALASGRGPGGAVVGAAGTLLLAAPMVYVLARSAVV